MEAVAGEVLPLELGQEGVQVRTGVGGRVLTLAAGVPGDRVRVRPRVRGFAELDRLLAAAPERRVAPCPVLERCGACALQAMDYRAQLRAKSEALRRTLRDVGCPDGAIREVVGLARPFGHRTKLLMSAAGEAGALRFGFYRRGSLEPVPAEGCPVQHPQTLAVLATARQILDGHRVAPSAPRGEEGWLHALAVRADPTSGESELVLAARHRHPPGGEQLVAQLASIPSVAGVHLAANPARSSFPLEPPIHRLAGQGRTRFTLAGRQILLSPGTFLQTSAEAAEQLVALATADRWQRAVCVEESPAAVTDLARYVEREALPVKPIRGRVERHLRRVLDNGPDVVLLDPPRRGCQPEVIAALVERRPPVVLYVACGFDVFLRQARELVAGGYALTGAGAVDMFPHTAHLEVVARFEAGP
jgi:23S rRNA (uracil1939-C5)-methyltransferase